MKQNWILAGAVAAMLASAAPATRAQDATPAPPPAATAPDASMAPMPSDPAATPPMPSGSMAPNSMTPSGAIDFSVLSTTEFDYVDLKKAKADGFSDSQVASIANIARLTGFSFDSITKKVLNGKTFATIAQEDNLKLSDVLDVDAEKDKIAAYETAYEATGSMALKGSMAPMPMSSDTSMTPPAMPMMAPKDIVATAMGDKRFKTLVKELKKADLVSALEGPGPFTVFAPTDAAFKKLPKGALKDLEKDPTKLAAVLKYHVLPAKVDAATAMAMTSPTSPPTLEGSTLQVTSSNGSVMINDATVVTPDITASNGIIHAIDTVLMPTDLPASDTGTMPATPSTDTTTAPAAPTDTTGTTNPSTGAGTAAPAASPDTPGTNATPPAGGDATPPAANP